MSLSKELLKIFAKMFQIYAKETPGGKRIIEHYLKKLLDEQASKDDAYELLENIFFEENNHA